MRISDWSSDVCSSDRERRLLEDQMDAESEEREREKPADDAAHIGDFEQDDENQRGPDRGDRKLVSRNMGGEVGRGRHKIAPLYRHEGVAALNDPQTPAAGRLTGVPLGWKITGTFESNPI